MSGSYFYKVFKENSSYNSERFEPRWVDVVVWVIVWVCSVVLRRTVVGVDWLFDNLSGSHWWWLPLRRTVVGVDWRFDNLSGSHWWWLPFRLSKRQSTPTTVLLRTTLQTRTITQTTTKFFMEFTLSSKYSRNRFSIMIVNKLHDWCH